MELHVLTCSRFLLWDELCWSCSRFSPLWRISSCKDPSPQTSFREDSFSTFVWISLQITVLQISYLLRARSLCLHVCNTLLAHNPTTHRFLYETLFNKSLVVAASTFLVTNLFAETWRQRERECSCIMCWFGAAIPPFCVEWSGQLRKYSSDPLGGVVTLS